MEQKNNWLSGMMGLIVADALGVPVEFKQRTELKRDPVIGMRAYGTHDQPAGTWSDDSSMALATLDSIREKNGMDYEDLMERFSNWCLYGDYAPFDEVFDIGFATSHAIMNYGRGTRPLECGGTGENDNGNGSLMRILPACIYLLEREKKVCTSADEAIYRIHSVSALTHAHLRSQMGCGLYYFLVKAVLEQSGTLSERLQKGMDQGFSYYRRDLKNYPELEKYERLSDLTALKETPEEEIYSSGYVVHTLEAAVWCLLHADSYKETVLKAVNLGDDTDTVGAVAGGLAGLYYGYEAIPEEWLDVLQKRAWIEDLMKEIQ